ncbi:MAG: hypothetical protein M1830_005254, partial [Pleopsidium flavum]
VWCIATLDWRSPIGESEDLKEKELYYLAWRGVQEAKVVPTGDEMNRVLRVLRGSLHTQPRLRETSPWNYLDEKQFRVIASVYNPTQSSASLIVFDFLNQATEWASKRMNNLPQATDLGWFSRCPLEILAACFLVSETLSGRLHLLGGAVLGAFFKLVSLGMHTWMSRSVLDRQDVYGWCFAQYQTNLGHIISMDLDGIDPFAHPLHECLDIGDLRSSLRWQCLSLQRRDPDHLTQPGVVENRIYALARLRSRFCSCCWNKDGASPNILMEALSCVDDIATLAWLCRGQIGQAELHDCPKEALWRSVYEPRCSQAHRIERMILLLEMGGHVEDQVSDTGAPTSAFGRILQALVDEERESSGLSMTAVKVCKHFRRTAANPKSSPQARFFLTGELPDQEDIDSNSGFSTTALHEAVLARCYDAVEYLLRIQFPVHVLNQQRQTPFQLAKALAQDSAEPHQKLQSLRILALMKQNVAEADDESALPIGWVAKELTSGRCVYNEIYTNSITFKMPKFSLFEDRRLALGFRKIKALGQTYFVDLIRFISWDIPEAQNEPLDGWTSYDEAWFKRDIRETKARVLETPTWLTNSYRVVCFIAWSVWCILTSSYLNVFLIFLPLSIIARLANWDCRVLMGLSCLALMSLGSILTFTMEQVSMRLGAFGKDVAIAASESMVEFLIGVIAVSFGEVEFVKAIVVGGIVNNICL